MDLERRNQTMHIVLSAERRAEQHPVYIDRSVVIADCIREIQSLVRPLAHSPITRGEGYARATCLEERLVGENPYGGIARAKRILRQPRKGQAENLIWLRMGRGNPDRH